MKIVKIINSIIGKQINTIKSLSNQCLDKYKNYTIANAHLCILIIYKY